MAALRRRRWPTNGTDTLFQAATGTGASRLVVESVAFKLSGAAAEAVEHLERSTREFAGEALILRFGRLWGQHTAYDAPPAPPAVGIDKAGAEAARLLASAPPGTYVVT